MKEFNSLSHNRPMRKVDSASTIASKKYARITPQLRDKLAHLIIQQNFTIKNVIKRFIQAAKLLNINYSSAKTIFANYRNSIRTAPLGTSQVSFTVKELINPALKLIYTVGGRYEGETQSISRIK